MVLLVGLRHGTCDASLGVDDDLRYLVGRLRAVWPDLHVHVRADSGLGVPSMYDVCRELRLSYTFGIGANARLRALSEDLMEMALEEYKKTGEIRRSFLPVDYRARSRAESRPVVIKVEANPEGTNRRAVVTNRPGCRVLPSAIHDEYVMRGESENRNKELKVELHAGRLSDHRFLANFFRLYLHAAALNLLVRLRHAVVEVAAKSADTGPSAGLPTEALDQPAGRRSFNERRDRDPLGGGFACTWRSLLIKVAAEVITRSRRVIVRLSGSWPHLDQFLKVSRAVSGPRVASSSP
jgi:Transposase DDE domain group 1